METTERIIELLHRNLQEVFGEGDATRRRAAIDEFYTDDCVLYGPPGAFVGRDALDKFAGDLRATHPHFVYTPRGEAQAVLWAGRDNCPRRKDCCAIRFPQSKILLVLHDMDHTVEDLNKHLDGPEKGFISVGIYEVDDDTLRICHTWKGQTKRRRSTRSPRGRGWYSQCGSERRSNGES